MPVSLPFSLPLPLPLSLCLSCSSLRNSIIKFSWSIRFNCSFYLGACGLGLSLNEQPSSEAYNVLTGTESSADRGVCVCQPGLVALLACQAHSSRIRAGKRASKRRTQNSFKAQNGVPMEHFSGGTTCLHLPSVFSSAYGTGTHFFCNGHFHLPQFPPSRTQSSPLSTSATNSHFGTMK